MSSELILGQWRFFSAQNLFWTEEHILDLGTYSIELQTQSIKLRFNFQIWENWQKKYLQKQSKICQKHRCFEVVLIDKRAEVGVQGTLEHWAVCSQQRAVRPLSNASNCDSTTLHWPPPHLCWPQWYFALPTALRRHYSGVNAKRQNSHRQKTDD